MMKDLENWSDAHLDPPEDKIIGYDWKGHELYGYEFGFMIDGEFVCEDDIVEYIESVYGKDMSGDIIGGD